MYRKLQAVQVLYFFSVQLALYFASPGMELDMAEQVWLSDKYALVYGSQPPLYTWIARSLLLVSGGSLLPLYLFKATLLSVIVGALLSIGRRAGFSDQQLVGVLAGSFWMPTLLWESQRDLTHTVLATAIAALTLRETTIAAVTSGALGAIRLGLLLAAGTLAKYNYILFALLWGAICLRPQARTQPAARRIAFAGIALGLLLILPHIAAATRADDLWFESADKFELKESPRWKGLADAAGSLLIVATPLLGLLGLSGFRGISALRAFATSSELLHRLNRLAMFSTLGILGITALSGASEIRERWLWPLFFYLPLIAAGLIPHVTRSTARRYVAIGLVAALAAGIALPMRTLAADALGSHNRMNLPYRELMRQIAETQETQPDFVIVDGLLPAGAARLSFPNARIYVYDRPNPAPPPRGAGLLIGRAETRAREPFEQWLDRMDLVPSAEPTEVSAPLYRSTRKMATLWWAPVQVRTAVHFDDVEER